MVRNIRFELDWEGGECSIRGDRTCVELIEQFEIPDKPGYYDNEATHYYDGKRLADSWTSPHPSPMWTAGGTRSGPIPRGISTSNPAEGGYPSSGTRFPASSPNSSASEFDLAGETDAVGLLDSFKGLARDRRPR